MSSITDYISRRDQFDNLSPVDQLKKLGVKSAPSKKILTEEQDKENKKSHNEEFYLQKKICGRINDTYFGTLFISDFAAGLHLPSWLALERSKQACIDKWLDLTILEPRGGYFGLIIEIKTIKGDVFLKDGSISQSQHALAQHQTIVKLCEMGYLALFGIGEENIWKIITLYKKLPLTIPVKLFKDHDKRVF